MNAKTLTITEDYYALESLGAEARKQRRLGRIGVLTEMILQEICHMAGEEASDGLKSRLIQAGVNVGREMRNVLD